MDFFLYYSQTLCRLFLYLLMYNCIYYTWNIQDKWILPVTWCESTCNLTDALMYKHFLLNAVFSKLLQVVQFSYFMHFNPFMYTIWTSMLYSCFAFCFHLLLHTLYQITFCIHYLTSKIHINNHHCHPIDLPWHQHVSWCSWVHMHNLMLIRIVLHTLYLYIHLTITLHLQYNGQVKFQNNKTWHHIVSHTQFTPDVIYCTSARKEFAVNHYTMLNSRLTIQLVLITFVQFPHKRALTMVSPSNGCHSNSKWVTWYVLKACTLTQGK